MKNENGIEKSAILTGHTLVNILNYNNITISGNATYTKEGNRLTITSNAVSSYGMLQFHVKDMLKNTKYIVFHKNVKSSNLPTSSTTIKCYGYYKNNRKTVALGSGYQGGNYQIIDLTNEKLDYDTITLRVHASTEPAMANTLTVEDLMMIEYQDGMENWDIPYFEGMQSVKVPVLKTVGKNLFDKTSLTQSKIINASTGEVADTDSKWFLSEYMGVQGMANITISSSNMKPFGHRYRFLDENFNVLYFKNQEQVGNQTYTVPKGSYYFQISVML